MLELVAIGPDSDQTLHYPLTEKTLVVLGRRVEGGITIAWDKLISREHAELTLNGETLHVEKMPTASNPIRVDGNETEEFQIGIGESFSIGRTDFRLTEVTAETASNNSPPVVETVPPEEIVEELLLGALNNDDQLETFGQYEIEKVLGQGDMGIVYLALDKMLNRTVALKILPLRYDPGSRVAERFRIEARSLAQLHHPNIVTLFEAGILDDRTFLALEYVEGMDALKLLKKYGPFTEARSTDLIYQSASALEHIQKFNLVHRDIKPSNMLLKRDGQLKLADMGLSRARDEAQAEGAALTMENTVLGSLNYISPEQARDSHMADIRSDIYSLGCTWYYLLTGELPFSGTSPTAILKAQTHDPLPDPRKLNSDISDHTIRVMKKMTEKSPDNRYQSASELLADIDW